MGLSVKYNKNVSDCMIGNSQSYNPIRFQLRRSSHKTDIYESGIELSKL